MTCETNNQDRADWWWKVEGDTPEIGRAAATGARGPYDTWWRANGAAEAYLRNQIAEGRRALSKLRRLRLPASGKE